LNSKKKKKDTDAHITKVARALTEEVGDSVKVVERVACSVADNVRDNTRSGFFFFTCVLHALTFFLSCSKIVVDEIKYLYHICGTIVGHRD